jgi:type IV secretory pathway VirB2 component (pilin)
MYILLPYIVIETTKGGTMRTIRNLAMIVGVVSISALLLHTDVALAVDGAAQTESFIKNIVRALVGIAGAVAVVFMVVGGFHYITSSGHPEKLDKAKKTLLYAGVGLVIVLAAYSIVDFVAGIAKSSFGS